MKLDREIGMTVVPSSLSPDGREIAARIERVRAQMRRRGLTHYICQSPDNILYLTNVAIQVHERPFIVVVPERGALIFLIPRLDQEQIPARTLGEVEFLHYSEFPAPAGSQWSDGLRSVLTAGARVGIEGGCPLSVAKVLPGTPTALDVVDDVRMVKSEFEVARIAYSGRLMSQGHADLLAMAAPDVPALRIHQRVTQGLTQRLLGDNPAANMLATGIAALVQPPRYSHDPHNFFADASVTLASGGPHVSVVAGRANGYGAEVERTFFLGAVPEAAKRPFEAMLEARALAFELCVPGFVMGELDRRVAGLLRARGYGENLLHRTGHSFGVTGHEAPFLADGYEREILPNMVFSIEPGIYLPGIGGFRFSDTVLVTGTGNVALTSAPETLEALTLPLGQRH